jgi:hypothetical protein
VNLSLEWFELKKIDKKLKQLNLIKNIDWLAIDQKPVK